MDRRSVILNWPDDLPDVIIRALRKEYLPGTPISETRFGPLDFLCSLQLPLLLLRPESLSDLGFDLLDKGRLGLFLLELIGESIENRSVDALLFNDLSSFSPILTALQEVI